MGLIGPLVAPLSERQSYAPFAFNWIAYSCSSGPIVRNLILSRQIDCTSQVIFGMSF